MDSVAKDDILEFRLNSWMENAAICGLVNILGEEKVTVREQSVAVPIEELRNFEEAYFTYFAKQYEKLSSLTKVLSYEDEMNRHQREDFIHFDQKAYERLHKYLAVLNQYAEKGGSYLAVYPLIDSSIDILSLLGQVKNEKKEKINFAQNSDQAIKQVRTIYDLLTDVFGYFHREDVQRYLSAKIQIYNVINNGYGNVSFLNRQESKGDFFEKYHDYFVESMFDYLEENHEKDKLTCTNCGHPIKKGVISYSFINQAGYDANKKQSNAWSFTNDLFMCPVCRLLYTCIPAGFTYVYKQGLFVNDNHSVRTLLNVNKGIRLNVLSLNKTEVKTIDTYAALIRTLQDSMNRQHHRELRDIQVVRYENEQYYFNILPKHVLRTIDQSKDQLPELFNAGFILNGEYKSLYQEIITRLMNNTNLFLLIYQVLRLKNYDDRIRISSFDIMRMNKINLKFLKELGKMDEELKLNGKDLENIKAAGYNLKKEYYDSANKNKAKSVSGRLLEALRIGNKDTFMNVLLNSYLYFNKPVPNFFLKPHLSDSLFQIIGTSFVTGMIGEIKDSKGGNDNE